MTKKFLFIFMMLFGGVSLLQAATIPLKVGIEDDAQLCLDIPSRLLDLGTLTKMVTSWPCRPPRATTSSLSTTRMTYWSILRSCPQARARSFCPLLSPVTLKSASRPLPIIITVTSRCKTISLVGAALGCPHLLILKQSNNMMKKVIISCVLLVAPLAVFA